MGETRCHRSFSYHGSVQESAPLVARQAWVAPPIAAQLYAADGFRNRGTHLVMFQSSDHLDHFGSENKTTGHESGRRGWDEEWYRRSPLVHSGHPEPNNHTKITLFKTMVGPLALASYRLTLTY